MRAAVTTSSSATYKYNAPVVITHLNGYKLGLKKDSYGRFLLTWSTTVTASFSAKLYNAPIAITHIIGYKLGLNKTHLDDFFLQYGQQLIIVHTQVFK